MEKVLYRASLINLILTLSLLLLIGPTGYGQISYDVSIKTTPLKLANPGELVTHVFTVQNDGTSPDTYDLTLDLPNGWASLPTANKLNISAGDSKPVFVNVNVPESANADKYEISLTAQSTGDPSVQATKHTYIQVKSVPGFKLSWEEEPVRLGPGTTVNGKIKIANTGNLPDRYKIETLLPDNWTSSLEEDTIRLMPGQSRIFNISFTVPEGFQSGDQYRIEVIATSERNKDLEKNITSAGQLGPPLPEKVTGTLYPEWDTFTNISMNQNGDPSFYFSGRGDIPTLGEVSANLDVTSDGFDGGRLRIRKEHWGFALSNSSISGSYLGVSGLPLVTAEFEDITARLIYTDESKGISLEKVSDCCDVRAVMGSDTTETNYIFRELEGAVEFSNGVVLDGLITTTETQTASGTIVEGGLELTSEKFEIYPSFVKVYPGYHNQSPRLSAGVNLSYEEEELLANIDWNYSKTRLGEDPDYYYSTENDFYVSTTLELGDYVDSSMSLSFTRRKSDDDPISNDLYSNAVSLSMSGGNAMFWSIGANYSRTSDLVSDTVVSTNSLNGTLGLNVGETEHSVSASLTQTEGPAATALSNNFSLSSDFPEAPLSPSFSLNKGSDDTTLYANFSEDTAKGLSLNVSFSLSLVQQDRVALDISVSFPDPFRYCGPTKGQVRGNMFIDENDNGVLDSGEQVVSKSILSLNGIKAISGSSGDFAFPPVEPGNYQLKIEEIRTGLSSTREFPLIVNVVAGKTTQVLVPVRPRAWVRGVIYDDKNQNGVRDGNEQGMSGAIFSVKGEGVTRSARSGTNGRFALDLRPGTYNVELRKSSLPKRYEPTTASAVQINARKYDKTEVSFGVYQKPRPVVVTFGPPTARFTYSPENPVVNENITLDATESSAIETKISTYQWKITNDNKVITREGEKVSIKISEPGSWEVSLTITDKNGLKAKAVKSIQVLKS